jgi:hypothetical protein
MLKNKFLKELSKLKIKNYLQNLHSKFIPINLRKSFEVFCVFETELNTIVKTSSEKTLSLAKLDFWEKTINDIFEVS